MNALDGYSPDEIEAGTAELMFHLANPRLDPIIWRVQGGWDTSPEAA